MLRVTVELWPFGNSGARRTLAAMDIWNDGKGTAERGNYGGRVYAVRYGKFSTDELIRSDIKVSDYPRQSRHVWNLVAEALESVGYRARRKATSGSNSEPPSV